MIYSDEDKKLVDQFKATNAGLRKQLNNLNNEIDRILIKKSMKLGLQKLPNVSKKITDPNIIQQQIDNLKKRLQNQMHDLEAYKSKASINYYEMIKHIQFQLKQKQLSMEQCKKIIKEYQRKDKIANFQASKNVQGKFEKRITKLQDDISRLQQQEKQLMKQISCQQVSGQKSHNYMQQLTTKHEEALGKKQKEKDKQKLYPVQNQPNKNQFNSIGDQQWRELKKQFLLFKQTKQSQQFALNQQNQRLRNQIKQWQRKLKDKKKRIQSVTMSLQKNKQRNSRIYSTLADPGNNHNPSFRYRDRSNSIQYNSKI